MAQFVLALHTSPNAAQPAHYRSLLALRFAQAAVTAGHRISQVFFYQSAVLHGHAAAAQDIATQWQAFAQQHHIPLVLCHTVAATEYQLEQLAEGYSNGGLTEFATAVAAADKVVQF